jgi:hypothetical protein
MIWREGFAYERFDLTEPVFEGGLEKIGSLIIGVRQGQSPDFEQCVTGKDWQRIIAQLLAPEELEELGHHLGRSVGPQTRFWPRMVLDFWEIVETAPTFESQCGKRFWVFARPSQTQGWREKESSR